MVYGYINWATVGVGEAVGTGDGDGDGTGVDETTVGGIAGETACAWQAVKIRMSKKEDIEKGCTHRPEGFWKNPPELRQPSGRFA